MFRLLTDSACDLPYQMLRQHRIMCLSMPVRIDGEERLDDRGRQFDLARFYAALRQGHLPTTAQVPLGQFVEAFTEAAIARTPILYLGLSSGVSGTYATAHQAKVMVQADYPDAQIELVDSLTGSLGLGLMVLDAAKQRQEGVGVTTVAAWLRANRLRYQQWFTVADLAHLVAGGRLSRGAAALGGLLKIQPLLTLDAEGQMQPFQKVRARAKAIAALAALALPVIAQNPRHQVIVAGVDAPQDAASLAALITQEAPQTPLAIHQIGPSVASHAGPDALAVFVKGKTPRS